MAVHEKLKPHVCDRCGKAFVRKGKLTEHINAIHLKIYKYKCSDCDKAFNWPTALKSHIEAFHKGDDRNWQCEQCGYAAKTKNAFYSHKKLVHGNNIEKTGHFVCDFVYEGKLCEFTFDTRKL